METLKPSSKANATRLALEYLTIDPRLQSREIKPSVVKDYTAVLRRGGGFPPIRVVRDSRDRYYLVDGHHRVAASKEVNGLFDIAAEIVEGTFTDALWFSWAANRDHGLRRSQEAKRRAIRAALTHSKWGKKSDRAIGLHIGCDHKTVGAMRRHLQAGEFPKADVAVDSESPSKQAILRACKILVGVDESKRPAMTDEEQALVKCGYEKLGRILEL